MQRRGIGARLLQRLIADCEARGVRQMIAVIGDYANAGSIAPHHHAGLHMIGTPPAVGLKAARWLDTAIIQRPLGCRAGTLP